jgi:hypothetical protein
MSLPRTPPVGHRRMARGLAWALLVIVGVLIGALAKVLYPWIYFAALDVWGLTVSAPSLGHAVGQPGALKILPVLLILSALGLLAFGLLVGLALLSIPIARAARLPKPQWIPAIILIPLAVCGLLLLLVGPANLTGYSYF